MQPKAREDEDGDQDSCLKRTNTRRIVYKFKFKGGYFIS